MIIRTPQYTEYRPHWNPMWGPKPRHRRPETNRRRHDQKVPGFIDQYYALQRAAHSPDEYIEILSAFQNNPGDPFKIATALAINNAVDYAYGTRAQLLKSNVYKQSWYRLPAGLDTILSPGR